MIDIRDKKIMFLGFGAVAKCVLDYFDKYFKFNNRKIVLVDKSKDAFNVKKGPKMIVLNVDATNFKELLDTLGFGKHDIIIDLTTSSATYFFIKMCLLHGIYYINTSIEDHNDEMLGSSIDCQQRTVASINSHFKNPKCTILIECGQNPGLIQHYVLYALTEMGSLRKLKSTSKRKLMQKVISDYKIGTIFMSEIDNMVTNQPLKPDIIYNTWSVAGYVVESLDRTELVCGKTNKFIKPILPLEKMNKITMDIYEKIKGPSDYDVIFMNENGFKSKLNSICPVLNGDKIEFVNYEGKLIHHGEIFDLARYFGKNAPFMSYVYKTNPYIDQSIDSFKQRNNASDGVLYLYVNQENNFKVFDGQNMSGHDSIGCTIFCGEKDIERIFWCGSILSTKDKNVNPEHTPTIVQVAAGVLSGLSYIIDNPDLGCIEPTDIDTEYMLEKSVPLLGNFFFKEIPKEKFNAPFLYSE